MGQWKPLIRSAALSVGQRELNASAVLTRSARSACWTSLRTPAHEPQTCPTAFSLGQCLQRSGSAMFLLFALLSELGRLHARLGKTTVASTSFSFHSKQGPALPGEQFPFLWDLYQPPSQFSCWCTPHLTIPQARVVTEDVGHGILSLNQASRVLAAEMQPVFPGQPICGQRF